MTTATSPDRLELLPIKQLKPSPDNPRQDLGDLSELAASIKSVGVLEPLIGTRQNGDILVVVGHRRLAAAKKAGLQDVPVILRTLDDKQRLEAMLIENLQREDLDPLEEAGAYKRLLGLGHTQEQLAERLGRSQSHISKRLSLLELPAPAHKALHSGGISVQDALELTKLARDPKRVERALKGPDRWNGIKGSVSRELGELEAEEKRAAARAQLQSAGVKILYEGPWHRSNLKAKLLTGQKEFSYDVVEMTPAKHEAFQKAAGESCHAAAIDQDGKVLYVCTNPKAHPEAKPSRSSQNLSPSEKAARTKRLEEQRQQKEATAARTEFMRKLIANFRKGNSATHIIGQFVQHASSDEARIALELLDDKPKKKVGGAAAYNPDLLARYADKGENDLWRAALALAFATGEMPLRSGYGRGKTGARHVAFLQASGYKLKAIEKKAASSRY